MESERYIPDENPRVPCEECGTTELWSDIQESGDWQVSDDPRVRFLCPECKGYEMDVTCSCGRAFKGPIQEEHDKLIDHILGCESVGVGDE